MMKSLLCLFLLMFSAGQVLAEPVAGTVLKEPVTGMEFVWVPSGCFKMGSNDGEAYEKPVHEVCVKGFWLGKYEVTQEQYKRITGINPSDFVAPNNPVDQVSWDDAVLYALAYGKLIGVPMRLPTEAEWEYACRAGGQHEKYCGEGDPAELAWTGSNTDYSTSPVGKLRPNAWGLYDMSGNVWEWVEDCWNLNYKGAPQDGSAWLTGNCNRRVARGGAWDVNDANGEHLVRAAKRGRGDHRYRLNVVGFRVAIGAPVINFVP
jgi:formylglycine-generating enzyme required for sulfatase activity